MSTTPGLPDAIGSVGPFGVAVVNLLVALGGLATAYLGWRGGKAGMRKVREWRSGPAPGP